MTATLSTGLTQITAYLLTSPRLSLSLTRPGQILGTQSGNFLSSSLEILLRHSRHDVVHRQGWGGITPWERQCSAQDTQELPLHFRAGFFFFVPGRCKIMSWPKNLDKATPNPFASSSARQTRENTQADPAGFPGSLGSLRG